MKKILFLDIDGVINSMRSAVALGGYPWNVDPKDMCLFDHVAVAWIRKICKDTGAKIVLSSTWRKSVDFKLIGKKLELPIVDKTPVLYSGSRGQEINCWVIAQKPDVYAIVDDDNDMMQKQRRFFVRTDPYNGLSYENALRLIEILGEKNGKKET